MRSIIVIAACIISIGSVFAQNKKLSKQEVFSDINSGDTVLFDLVSASFVNKVLSIPVFLITDDKINALDFSLMFNEEKITLDTILKTSQSLEMSYFLNPNDRKLRFTSYSLSNYNTDKKIVTLQFITSATSINEADFFNITAYLNGDLCSNKFSAKTFTTTSIKENELLDMFEIMPNPSSNYIEIKCEENSKLTLIDNSGIILDKIQKTKSLEIISLINYPNGIYHLMLENDKIVKTKKFIKSN
ncbi:MAG: hypothetical protein RLZZ546_2755 [Bacteroidota bacterium]|jgi:hypothetical protein